MAKMNAVPEPTLGVFATLARIIQVIWLFFSMVVAIWWNHAWSRPGPDTETQRDAMYRRQAIRFRQTAESLGGILIKVGQFLSSRVDLLPKSFIDEIQALQDHVEPSLWEPIAKILGEDLGPLEDRFLRFEQTPLASASLGQVYRAVLPDGRDVAVKVRRPGIEAKVGADMRALAVIVALTVRFSRFGRTFDLYTVLREFRQSIAEELDYLAEAANTEKIREVLAEYSFVQVPHTYARWSTARVLTMEFKSGIKITQVDVLREHGIDPTRLAEQLIRIYLHMVMGEGTYHADPHPGNIWVDWDGNLVLFDYGMVGQLDLGFKRQIRKLFVAISRRNAKALLESMDALGMILPNADRVQLRQRLTYMLERYYAETLNQLASLDIPRLLRDFENLLHDDAIQVPGKLAFLGRAIAILVGLATTLDPDINLIRLFAPYARRFVTEDNGGMAGFAASKARSMALDAFELPGLASRVLRRIDEGDLDGQIRWTEGSQEIRRLRQSVDAVAHSLYVLALLFSAVLLLGQGRPRLAGGALILAILASLLTWIRRRRS